MGESGNRTVILITVVSLSVIFLMLATGLSFGHHHARHFGDRRDRTAGGPGIIAFLGLHGIVGLTTFVVNLLVSIGIAAGTDYGIFFFGRYKEARAAGEDRETAFYTTYRGVAKVVLASGSRSPARSSACIHAAALFPTPWRPRRVGNLGRCRSSPHACSRHSGSWQPFRLVRAQAADSYSRWRRVGTAVVRWPAPILVATVALSLIGLLTLPGYKPSYNDQVLPQEIPAN